MDSDPENIIRQVLEDALAAGKGDGAQTLLAVQAVLRARPDMTIADAKAVVNPKEKPRRSGASNSG